MRYEITPVAKPRDIYRYDVAQRTAALPYYAHRLQSIAEVLWASRLYIPGLTVISLLFLASGSVMGGCAFLAFFTIFMLIFCSDIISTLQPLFLICLLTTGIFENYSILSDYWLVGAMGIAALVIHMVWYPTPFRRGVFSNSLSAVSLATALGGAGYISAKEYFTPVALYYSLGLGIGMLAAYVLIKSQLCQKRFYSVPLRFAEIIYSCGILTGAVVLNVYICNLSEFTKNFATIYFSYRNFCATILLMAMPIPCLFIKNSRWHVLSLVFMYVMLMMTGSRSGLVFGQVLLVADLVYIYVTNREKKKVYRKWIAICAVPAVAFIFFMTKTLFASRLVDGALISATDSRVAFFINGIKDFLTNPVFGKGLGCMDNSDIFLGVSGSIVWYHNMIAQILGSMGLVGASAFAWQMWDRVKLLISRHSSVTAVFAMSYAGIVMISMTNPGEFCPLPNEFLVIMMFAILEELPAVTVEKRKMLR